MRSFRARAPRLASQELDPPAWVDWDGRPGAGTAACAGGYHPPAASISAAAVSPPTPSRNLRRSGDRAPARCRPGDVASSACIGGDSWSPCAAWRSSLMGVLLPCHPVSRHGFAADSRMNGQDNRARHHRHTTWHGPSVAERRRGRRPLPAADGPQAHAPSRSPRATRSRWHQETLIEYATLEYRSLPVQRSAANRPASNAAERCMISTWVVVALLADSALLPARHCPVWTRRRSAGGRKRPHASPPGTAWCDAPRSCPGGS